MEPRPPAGKAEILALLLAATLAVVVTWGFWGFAYDDAFITYRYADNLARGEGLVYNPGERVLGTTAPGYATLLALLAMATSAIGIGVPQWGTLSSTGAILAVVVLLGRAWRTAAPGQRAIVVGLFASLALPLRWNVEMLGTETLPIMGLLAWAAHLALDGRRPVLAGSLVAAAMVLRLDAALGAAAIGVTLWSTQRRFPRAFAVAGLAPLVPWLVGLTLYFGSPFPQTLATRRSELPLAPASYSAAQWAWLRRGLPLFACLLLVALAVAGLVGLARAGAWRHPTIAALALWVALGELFYRLVGVPFCAWYHEASLHALLALAAYGAAVATAPLARAVGPTGRAAAVALLALPVLWPSAAFVVERWGEPPDPRYGVYREIGEWLRQEAAPGDAVASVEIGVLGYTSRRPVLDLVGLVTPEALAARDRLDQLVLERRPRFLVDNPTFRRDYLGAILSNREVRRRYGVTEVFEHPRYGRKVRVLEIAADAAPGR